VLGPAHVGMTRVDDTTVVLVVAGAENVVVETTTEVVVGEVAIRLQAEETTEVGYFVRTEGVMLLAAASRLVIMSVTVVYEVGVTVAVVVVVVRAAE
jgi:hypothetical protein